MNRFRFSDLIQQQLTELKAKETIPSSIKFVDGIFDDSGVNGDWIIRDEDFDTFPRVLAKINETIYSFDSGSSEIEITLTIETNPDLQDRNRSKLINDSESLLILLLTKVSRSNNDFTLSDNIEITYKDLKQSDKHQIASVSATTKFIKPNEDICNEITFDISE